ncbi:MAG: hypothetical protein HQK76_18120 [Desulfobacterales bacterium]|nr:hypothetical protein [Desulfobacterales bacterium]
MIEEIKKKNNSLIESIEKLHNDVEEKSERIFRDYPALLEKAFRNRGLELDADSRDPNYTFKKRFFSLNKNPLKEEGTDIKEIGQKLRNKIGIFIMRRLKQDVAKDLPIKFDWEHCVLKKLSLTVGNLYSRQVKC